MKPECNPELSNGHAGSCVGLLHTFVLIWKAKWATLFSVIQGTIDYPLVYLALAIIQGKHAISPLAVSWIVWFFSDLFTKAM